MADQRTRMSPARFLAPLALIAVIVAFFAILSESGGSGSSSSSNQGSQTTSATSGSKTTSGKTGSTTTTTARTKRRNYIVKVGDTFGTIASKTGVSVETLQTLNPAVDPHSMTVGQQIRLR